MVVPRSMPFAIPEGREKVLALFLDERRARKTTPPVDDAVLQRVGERLGLTTETWHGVS
jgi:hypothetical protein